MVKIETLLQQSAPPKVEYFLNKNNRISQNLWESYKSQREEIKNIYSNVYDWHGTGRYKFDGNTKEVVDVLDGIVKEGGLKPHLDEWNYKAGPGHTVSTTPFRPYATFYSDMYMQKNDPLEFAYGASHDWGGYIGDKIILGSGGTFVDLLRSRNFTKKFNEWTERRIGKKTSFFKLAYKYIRPQGAIDSKIEGNYPLLIGIKKLDHVTSENLAPIYGNSERRTDKLIPLSEITHLEVPEKYLSQARADLQGLWTKYELDKANLPMPEVVSREMGEIYCSEFTPKKLMTFDVFRENNDEYPAYKGRFKSHSIRTARESYHVVKLFTKLGTISTLDALKSKLLPKRKNKSENINPDIDLDKLNTYRPYNFSENDLQPENLNKGVEYSLSQFYKWRDENPDLVENYIQACIDNLKGLKVDYSRTVRIRRSITPFAIRHFKQRQMMSQLMDFGVRNLSEIPEEKKLRIFTKKSLENERALKKGLKQFDDITTFLDRQFPALKDTPEISEVNERLKKLYSILPQRVIENGAMGKVARTILGVATIADYDLLNVSSEEKKEKLRKVVYGAYVLGALYAIVDDTFQDMGTNYFSKKARDAYHKTILEGLHTGLPIDITHLPEHPISSEVKILYDLLTKHYPISEYPTLYHAAESMYISQDRDAERKINDSEINDLKSLYPDLLIKSGLTRVVANILSGRKLDSDFYSKTLNTLLSDQLRDDLIDYAEDVKAGKLTAFTYPIEKANTNPLYDIFAYDAYVANVVQPGSEKTFALSEAVFLSSYFASHPDEAKRLTNEYCQNQEKLSELMQLIAILPKATIKRITPIDQQVKDVISQKSSNRRQIDADPQTFALDNLSIVNDVINDFVKLKEKKDPENEINNIMQYSLEGGGKRLRPILTLMLADSLGVDPKPLTPMLLASELFHTASLLLDDLPWQDNSSTRRGKATAHTVYDPVSVELTSVSMLLNGMEVLQSLTKIYPPQNIPEITSYIAEVVQKVCLGQNMDLHMNRASVSEIKCEDVLNMYDLKTSVAIEASLVPLMMLEKRSKEEIEHIKQFAHHAGLVFQIKDDILDASSTKEVLGKDVEQDVDKINIVRLYGLQKAEELMNYHLAEAIKNCKDLPFNTNLFEGIVKYFAERKH